MRADAPEFIPFSVTAAVAKIKAKKDEILLESKTVPPPHSRNSTCNVANKIEPPPNSSSLLSSQIDHYQNHILPFSCGDDDSGGISNNGSITKDVKSMSNSHNSHDHTHSNLNTKSKSYINYNKNKKNTFGRRRHHKLRSNQKHSNHESHLKSTIDCNNHNINKMNRMNTSLSTSAATNNSCIIRSNCNQNCNPTEQQKKEVEERASASGARSKNLIYNNNNNNNNNHNHIIEMKKPTLLSLALPSSSNNNFKNYSKKKQATTNNNNKNNSYNKIHQKHTNGIAGDCHNKNKKSKKKKKNDLDSIQTKQTFIITNDEETFPTLQSNKDTCAKVINNINTRHTSTYQGNDNFCDTNLWSNVADRGHKKSIQEQIKHDQELERMKYQINTFTKLEILHSTTIKQNDNDNNDQTGTCCHKNTGTACTNNIEIINNSDFNDHDYGYFDDINNGIGNDIGNYISFDQHQRTNGINFNDELMSIQTKRTIMNHKAITNTSTVQINKQKKYNFGSTTLKTDKLKERWYRALQERQLREEQKRIDNLQSMDTLKISPLDPGQEGSHDDLDCDSFLNPSESSYKASTNRSHSFDDSSNECTRSDDDDDDNVSSSDSSTSLSTLVLLKYTEKEYPLHSAIIDSDENAVMLLLSYPPELVGRDKKVSIKNLQKMIGGRLNNLHPSLDEGVSLSILHFAILLDKPNIVRSMLSIGRKMNLDFVTSTLSIDDMKNDLKCSALMMACTYNLEECAKVILSFGPKMNAKSSKSGDLAIHIACRLSRPSIVQLLIPFSNGSTSSAHRRTLCSQNRKGETPLHICCSLGRIEIVDILLHSCSSSFIVKALEIEDKRGYTPIMVAIESGNTTLVSQLLSWRNNIRSSDVLPKNCLVMAVATQSLDMTSLLIQCLDSNQNYNLNGALCKALSTFDDSSENGMEIIRCLIEAGADPFAPCTKLLIQLDNDDLFYCTTSLSVAVYKGQVKFVACILDTFLATQKKSNVERRMDPLLLQSKTESYFQMVEKLETGRIQRSGQEAILCVLHTYVNNSNIDDSLSTRRLGCCLSMFRRGLNLDRSTLKALWKDEPQKIPYAMMLHEMETKAACFEGFYCHQILQDTASCQGEVRNTYNRSKASTWSRILLELSWMKDEYPIGTILCPWIKSQQQILPKTVGKGNVKHEDDEIYVIVDNQRLIANKSILASKSPKLEAQIRFAEMTMVENETDKPQIWLDVSLDLFKLFIQHCYHGSMYGLSANKVLCCQQLLDLHLLGQEYLCQSLSLECEMRLLSSEPFQCVCWNCCDRVEFDQVKKEITCFYTWSCNSSKLIESENVLGITAHFDELQDQNSYHIKAEINDIIKKEIVFKPCELLFALAWITIILNFMDVLRSDPYLAVYHSTMSEFGDIDDQSLECFGDAIAVLLLQNCLDTLYK